MCTELLCVSVDTGGWLRLTLRPSVPIPWVYDETPALEREPQSHTCRRWDHVDPGETDQFPVHKVQLLRTVQNACSSHIKLNQCMQDPPQGSSPSPGCLCTRVLSQGSNLYSGIPCHSRITPIDCPRSTAICESEVVCNGLLCFVHSLACLPWHVLIRFRVSGGRTYNVLTHYIHQLTARRWRPRIEKVRNIRIKEVNVALVKNKILVFKFCFLSLIFVCHSSLYPWLSCLFQIDTPVQPGVVRQGI